MFPQNNALFLVAPIVAFIILFVIFIILVSLSQN
jgi:hypothetical protein